MNLVTQAAKDAVLNATAQELELRVAQFNARPASADACTPTRVDLSEIAIQQAVSQCGEFATIGQIIRALGGHPITTLPSEEAKIRHWLDVAGWERVKKIIGGARVWGYARPASTSPLDEFSTAPSTSLARLMQSQALAKSSHADLVNGTWTFKVSPPTLAGAGDYVLVPAQQVREALEADRLASLTVTS